MASSTARTVEAAASAGVRDGRSNALEPELLTVARAALQDAVRDDQQALAGLQGGSSRALPPAKPHGRTTGTEVWPTPWAPRPS